MSESALPEERPRPIVGWARWLFLGLMLWDLSTGLYLVGWPRHVMQWTQLPADSGAIFMRATGFYWLFVGYLQLRVVQRLRQWESRPRRGELAGRLSDLAVFRLVDWAWSLTAFISVAQRGTDGVVRFTATEWVLCFFMAANSAIIMAILQLTKELNATERS